MKLVVDVMGGDLGPATIIQGIIDYLNEISDIENLIVYAVGQEKIIQDVLEEKQFSDERLKIIDAPEIVDMNDKPLIAVRKKKKSSIAIGVELVKNGEGDCFISPGNTGAVMATATLKLGLIKGVERPAIATALPNVKKSITVLLDVGANVDCKANHLYQFALMGKEYAKIILNIDTPSVGLLNVGEEESKGNILTKNTYELLKSIKGFIGNVEGRDIYNAKANVVVCDGFTGNTILKVSEGLADTLINMIKQGIMSKFIYKIGALLLKPFFKEFKKTIDSSEYGGAPLLGIDGYCIICHGSSTSLAIKSALKVGSKFVTNNINEKIKESITI